MKLTVYSRRWGHEDAYEVERTENGWRIAHGPRGGECDTFGKPHLFKSCDNDGVNYPEALGGYMDWLWRKVKDGAISEDKTQEHLTELGNWIQLIEKNTPRGIWQGFK